jgi:hypothetical protein
MKYSDLEKELFAYINGETDSIEWDDEKSVELRSGRDLRYELDSVDSVELDDADFEELYEEMYSDQDEWYTNGDKRY